MHLRPRGRTGLGATLGLGDFLYHGRVIIAQTAAAPTRFIEAGSFIFGGKVLMETIDGWLVESSGNSLLYYSTTAIEEF